MKREKSAVVPLDVSLLARKIKAEPASPLKQGVAPFCPMLSQGWAFVEPYRNRLAPAVLEVQRHLVPALWTTMKPEGVELLWNEVEEGRLG
jgi:hypothetical protein